MKTNYEIIEKVSMKCEITIEPSFIANAWTVMYPECYNKEQLSKFVSELFLNGISFKYEDEKIIIFETVEF